MLQQSSIAIDYFAVFRTEDLLSVLYTVLLSPFNELHKVLLLTEKKCFYVGADNQSESHNMLPWCHYNYDCDPTNNFVIV